MGLDSMQLFAGFLLHMRMLERLTCDIEGKQQAKDVERYSIFPDGKKK